MHIICITMYVYIYIYRSIQIDRDIYQQYIYQQYSCPQQFLLPPNRLLDLGHVHQAIRRGAILQGHRHKGAKGRSADHHAGEPLLRVGKLL